MYLGASPVLLWVGAQPIRSRAPDQERRSDQNRKTCRRGAHDVRGAGGEAAHRSRALPSRLRPCGSDSVLRVLCVVAPGPVSLHAIVTQARFLEEPGRRQSSEAADDELASRDERLLQRLSVLVRKVDPVPPNVTTAARALPGPAAGRGPHPRRPLGADADARVVELWRPVRPPA